MKKLILALLALSLALTGACVPTATASRTAHLTVVLADEPYPIDYIASATVTITQIDVRGSAGTFTTVYQSPGQPLDLVTLRDGNTALLADADIPPGEYDQVRVCIADAAVTLTDGRTFPLRVPSGESSGIKLDTDFALPAGTASTMTVDVAIEDAFKPVPASGLTRPEDIAGFMLDLTLGMSVLVVPTPATQPG